MRHTLTSDQFERTPAGEYLLRVQIAQHTPFDQLVPAEHLSFAAHATGRGSIEDHAAGRPPPVIPSRLVSFDPEAREAIFAFAALPLELVIEATGDVDIPEEQEA